MTSEAKDVHELTDINSLASQHGSRDSHSAGAATTRIQEAPTKPPARHAIIVDGPFSNNAIHMPPRNQFWLPFFLRPTTLLSFLILFLLLAAVLPILYALSEKRNGLRTADQDKRLGWTYGPTAVFTFIAILWSQVDYRYRQLFPWKNMQRYKGFENADTTILLDYVSPWSINILYTSARRKHWLVALPVCASSILTIMVILSTGLFSLQSTTVSNRVLMSKQETFLSSGLRLNWTTRISEAPLTIAYGVRYLNLSLPHGTTESSVYPRFNVSTNASLKFQRGDILSMEMDVVTFDVPCENANIVLGPQRFRQPYWESNVTLTTPACSLTETMQLGGSQFGIGNAPGIFNIWTGNCSEVLSVGAMTRTNNTNGQPIQYVSNQRNETGRYQFTGVICAPSYNVSRKKVSYRMIPGTAGTEVNITAVPGATASQIPGLTTSELMNSVWRGGAYIGLANGLINATTPGHIPMELSNMTFLSSVIRSMHSIAGIQIIKEKYLTEEPQIMEGTVTRDEQRLFVRVIAFSFLEAMLVLLIAITATLIWMKPPRVVPRSPGSIGGCAALLAQSHVFTKHMDNLGSIQQHDLEQHCRTRKYRASFSLSEGQQTFAVHVSDTNAQKGLRPGSSTFTEPPKWWRPFTASTRTRIIVVVLPILVIVAVELLHRRSQSSGGITRVSPSSQKQEYAWTYIPAIFMVTIRLLFDTAAFTIKLFQPYSNLRRGGYSTSKTVQLDQLGKTSIQTLWESFRMRQMSVAAISAALLVGPFLTVIVSGLYSISPTETLKSVTVKQTSAWNTSFVKNGYLRQLDNRQSNFAQVRPGLILTANLSYPKWTYDTYALPTVELQEDNDTLKGAIPWSTGGVLSVVLPAVRSSLKCESVPEELVKIGFLLHSNFVSLSTTDAIPANCPKLDRWICSDNTGSDGELRLKPGDYFDCYSQYIFPANSSIHAIDSRCPTTGYALGRLASYYREENVSVLHCHPVFEQMDVVVNLTTPSFDLDPMQPPRPIESTVRMLWDAYPMVGGGSSTFLNNERGANTDTLSPWMKAAIYGLDGVPIEEIMGAENANKLAQRLNRVIEIMAAQQLNLWARAIPPFDDARNTEVVPSNVLSYNATLSFSDGSKLTQHTVSTRLLQGFLSFMTVCAIIAFSKQSTRGVLPYNPCSIATTASFIAGSKLLSADTLPPRSECSSEKELSRLLSGHQYSLGWWKRGEKLQFGIDIGDYHVKDIAEEPLQDGNDSVLFSIEITSLRVMKWKQSSLMAAV
ncbi:hypothetical protein BU24DRAFT_473406 [Aaosphaeria arxii CBS 175.79]|uniref:Uncharacterized protein n=1 Tax=Aaosphaeria arxii CBS 175.79 TaxID=1450172 RepID=A0A6A5XB80_9PLEO|nr:uncharacterized protein BU24DRAFT_473406 [Aaosphaeria arxii CBS 175.79]KAF2010228.1 hypothetical protein BU24DRAFT_473406 [Aaosphaeria arxii CBS 175.79]